MVCDCVELENNRFVKNIKQVSCAKCNKVLKNYYGLNEKYYVKESYGTRELVYNNIYEILGCDVKKQVLKLKDNEHDYKYCKYGSKIIYSGNPPQCNKHIGNDYHSCTDECYNFENKHDLLEDYDYIQGVKKINKDSCINGNKIKLEYLYEDDFNKAKKEAIKIIEEELEKLINKKRINNTPEIRKEIEEMQEQIKEKTNSRYLNKMFKDFIFEPHKVKKKEEYKSGGFEGDNERMVF
jgi:hypothetical protein